jgi:hypothetical protein
MSGFSNEYIRVRGVFPRQVLLCGKLKSLAGGSGTGEAGNQARRLLEGEDRPTLDIYLGCGHARVAVKRGCRLV